MAWMYAANHADLEWQVHVDGGRVCARPVTPDERIAAQRPDFVPEADEFRGASRFARVDDGWLVAFNHGEFGAALYWFSQDGSSHYRISENQIDHQIVEFFPTDKGWGAIEGLDHMGISEGSVVLVSRTAPQDRWQSQRTLRLPAAPYAIALPKQGPALVVVSNALVAINDLRRADVLLTDAPWAALYPNSVTLSPDERRLYIGMRQYVGEFDLHTRKLRMLLPPGAKLNQLPQDDEQRIRATYAR